jgi:hypothetical protein
MRDKCGITDVPSAVTTLASVFADPVAVEAVGSVRSRS